MFDIQKYLRLEMFPHMLCPGCGHGIVLGALLRAIDSLKLSQDEVVVVSGIGCSSRLSGYVDFDTLHTTHGRPLAFATGIKMARPELTVIVITGDGDGLSIGGNHLIHAARRNVGLTCLLLNNEIYGMTGGQAAPTTPQGKNSTTGPTSPFETPFDSCRLVEAAGASFVARGITYEPTTLEKLIVAAIQNPGFSFLEIISDCPEFFGRFNRMGNPADQILAQKQNVVDAKTAATLPPERLKGKMLTGILHHEPRPEYAASYQESFAHLGAQAR
ncbi:MAG: 2-oxoacid:ferredoxin oxidoreductase subunit beta [Acidobacteriia bacterium]|nr:2-oxoacid:ferredoxin oxidoreductase subunit beta [Terriglobia bacterium]